ncbi:MAG TPA: hypothetical protein VEQ38_12705 [Verrucomicrobiae bacterium]|nr:hypothetical protein [Verrucomicrobiae bacterium]
MRLKNLQDAEIGYQVLQWLYSLDVKPTIPGIQNMARLLALGDPKVKNVKMEDVVDDASLAALGEKYFLSGARSDGKK